MERIELNSDVGSETPVSEEKKPTRGKKKGKWVITGTSKKCSECGAEMHGWALREEFKFCPMCGVEME